MTTQKSDNPALAETLYSIVTELREIRVLLAQENKAEALSRDYYSILEAAELTSRFGLKQYAPFTLRRAAADGRLEAEKLDDSKTWRIPAAALLKVLSDGIPPERRTLSNRVP